jgi:hypothetical protein
MGRRLLAALSALAAVAAVPVTASTAHGTPPVTTTFPFQEINALVANCGAFQILANYEGTLTETVFFDQSGNPVRVSLHGKARGTLTNSVTGYTVQDAPTIAYFSFDLEHGTSTHVGVDYHITVPGEGVVVLQAGRIVFSDTSPEPIFIGGPHLGPPPVARAALCVALDH